MEAVLVNGGWGGGCFVKGRLGLMVFCKRKVGVEDVLVKEGCGRGRDV